MGRWGFASRARENFPQIDPVGMHVPADVICKIHFLRPLPLGDPVGMSYQGFEV